MSQILAIEGSDLRKRSLLDLREDHDGGIARTSIKLAIETDFSRKTVSQPGETDGELATSSKDT